MQALSRMAPHGTPIWNWKRGVVILVLVTFSTLLFITPTVASAQEGDDSQSSEAGLGVASGLLTIVYLPFKLAYAIGVSEPVSVHVDTQGTGQVSDERICALVRDTFPLTPGGIIDYLDLRRPIYRNTAAGGHFGRTEQEFNWEHTNKAAELAEAAGVQVATG